MGLSLTFCDDTKLTTVSATAVRFSRKWSVLVLRLFSNWCSFLRDNIATPSIEELTPHSHSWSFEMELLFGNKNWKSETKATWQKVVYILSVFWSVINWKFLILILLGSVVCLTARPCNNNKTAKCPPPQIETTRKFRQKCLFGAGSDSKRYGIKVGRKRHHRLLLSGHYGSLQPFSYITACCHLNQALLVGACGFCLLKHRHWSAAVITVRTRISQIRFHPEQRESTSVANVSWTRFFLSF